MQRLFIRVGEWRQSIYIMMDDISSDQVRDDITYDLVGLYDDNMDIEEGIESPFRLLDSVCEYYEPEQFSGHIGKQDDYVILCHISILPVVVFLQLGIMIYFVPCIGINLH